MKYGAFEREIAEFEHSALSHEPYEFVFICHIAPLFSMHFSVSLTAKLYKSIISHL